MRKSLISIGDSGVMA